VGAGLEKSSFKNILKSDFFYLNQIFLYLSQILYFFVQASNTKDDK